MLLLGLKDEPGPPSNRKNQSKHSCLKWRERLSEGGRRWVRPECVGAREAEKSLECLVMKRT